MKIELNFLENSHDYLLNSIDLYQIADEYGMHDAEKSCKDSKSKWKLAFILMVQAYELLLKEILHCIHPNLVFENIDFENIDFQNTISLHKSITRLTNFTEIKIESCEKIFLNKCIKLRNQFIHGKVSLTSEDIKAKYCRMYLLYKNMHYYLTKEEIEKIYSCKRHLVLSLEIELFCKEIKVFRGREIFKKDMDAVKQEIADNENFKYYVKENGKKKKRIRFGDEYKLSEKLPGYSFTLYTDFTYCDECLAERGEFHLEYCDLEICPFCFGQLLSCGCIDKDNKKNHMK